MPALTQQQWEEVRRAYVGSSKPARIIEARFGIAHATLYKRLRKEGWPRRNPGAATKPSLVAATIPVRRRLIRRLFRIIETELELMESRMQERVTSMAKGQDVPAVEREREARAVSTLVRSLDKLTEIAADLDRTTNGRGKSAAADADELFAEADRFRRELAERLSKFIPPSP